MISTTALLFSQMPLGNSNKIIASTFLHPCDLNIYLMDCYPVRSLGNLPMIITFPSNSLNIIASNSPKWHIWLLKNNEM